MSFDLKLINGDLSIKNGDFETVTSKEKLIQDILKIVITKAGSNPNAIWYGSLISKTLIGAPLDDKIQVAAAEGQLRLALNALQSLQIKQIEIQQPMTAAEQIASILDISVNRSKLDPRLISINIKCLSKAFEEVNVSFDVQTI